MMDESCESCLFWQELYSDKYEAFGKCRRYAPKPRIWSEMRPDEEGIVDTETCWPKTFDKDWCGEFQAATPNKDPVE